MISLLSLGMKIPFCPCQEVVTDLMSQIQELRTSISEKTETIDTLRQELGDINVSSFANKILKLSIRHSSQTQQVNRSFTQKQGSVFTQIWKYVLVKAQHAWVSAEPAEPLVCWHVVCFSRRQNHFSIFETSLTWREYNLCTLGNCWSRPDQKQISCYLWCLRVYGVP